MRWGTLLFVLFTGLVLVLAAGMTVTLRSAAPPQAAPIERFVSPGKVSAAHRFIAAECTTCHMPFKGVESNACIGCHAATAFSSKRSTSFHTSARSCTSCHVEHVGGRSPTQMNHDALKDSALWQPPARVSGPHARNFGGKAKLDCNGCHALRDPHLGLFGSDCATCHTTDAWSIAGYRHPSPNSRSCAECHRAPPSHYMGHFSMVSQPAAHQTVRVEACYACHTTDSFNNIRERGWYDHH